MYTGVIRPQDWQTYCVCDLAIASSIDAFALKSAHPAT